MSITWKLNRGEQSCLHATHRLNLIHIPITFHEDFPNGYRVMVCTKMRITKNKQKKKHETKKWKAKIIVPYTSS